MYIKITTIQAPKYDQELEKNLVKGEYVLVYKPVFDEKGGGFLRNKIRKFVTSTRQLLKVQPKEPLHAVYVSSYNAATKKAVCLNSWGDADPVVEIKSKDIIRLYSLYCVAERVRDSA